MNKILTLDTASDRSGPGRRLLVLVFLFWLAGWALAADQQTDPADCLGCHNTSPVLGVHAGTLLGATNRVAVCVDCHGVVTDLPLHEQAGEDLVRFDAAPTVLERLSGLHLPLNKSTLTAQNQTCLQCHNPDDLGALHWSHDAHGLELSCAACHQIHPKNDPVRGLSNTATIKLCVDCHRAQAREGEGERP